MVRMYREDGSADIEALVIKSRGKNRWKESGASTSEQVPGYRTRKGLMRKLLVTSTATWGNYLSRPLGQQNHPSPSDSLPRGAPAAMAVWQPIGDGARKRQKK